MKLDQILQDVNVLKYPKIISQEIDDVKIDSRKVQSGDLFIAMKGENFDGNDFVSFALKNGASYIVSEKDIPFDNVIVVDDSRKAYAQICKNFFDRACEKMKFIGVTGTNGKTTTVNIISNILKTNGNNVGVIGTLGAMYNNKEINTGMTTPDPYELHKIIKEMYEGGVEYVVMEVSAHALALHKLDGIKFEEGILTNITEDHLDYFKTMQNYADAKFSFFTPEYVKMGIVFGQDPYCKYLFMHPKVPIISYGKALGCDVLVKNPSTGLLGSQFTCNFLGKTFKVKSNLVGDYNIENLLAGIGATMSIGVEESVIQKGISSLAPVEGRFNIINLKGQSIIIDYAHTPDGLEKVLKTAKALSNNKLICIFGCGGNRDKQKRPIMGEIASKISDDVIITSDNPRYEDPEEIIEEIKVGAVKPCKCITNRQEAIEYALKKYKNNATIVIAGKGAEKYQEIKGTKYPFSDFDVVYNFYKKEQKPLKKNKSYPFDDEKY